MTFDLYIDVRTAHVHARIREYYGTGIRETDSVTGQIRKIPMKFDKRFDIDLGPSDIVLPKMELLRQHIGGQLK